MMDAAYGEGLGKSDVSTGRGMFDEIASRGRLQSVRGQEATHGKRGSVSYGPRLQICYLDHHEDLRRTQYWPSLRGTPRVKPSWALAQRQLPQTPEQAYEARTG